MRIVFIVTLALVACRPEAPTSTSTSTVPATTTATTTSTATATAGRTGTSASPDPGTIHPVEPAAVPNVRIDAIEVANPVVVTGRARTFENNVALRLRDARGVLIQETFTTATGEMGTFSPYRGMLWVTRDPGPRITVEALEYSAKDGSEQSLVSAERSFAVEAIETELYFPDSECTGVKAFRRSIPKSVSHARLLVEALIAGPLPSEAGATNPFPAGSGVRSVNLRNGVLTVDFNERLQSVGGSCRTQMIRASVTRTLEALPSVRRVVITAGGSEELALQP